MPLRANSAARLFIYNLVPALILFILIGCGEASAPDYEDTESNGAREAQAGALAMSGTAREGEDLFNTNCSRCHGLGAAGTEQGPPLLHRTYAPGITRT